MIENLHVRSGYSVHGFIVSTNFSLNYQQGTRELHRCVGDKGFHLAY